VFLLFGCAGLGKTLESPRITLANVRLQEIKAFETTLRIELRVFNTNDVPIRVKGIDCDIALNGKNFATGVAKTDKEIPAYGTATVPITVYSSLVDMVKGVIGLQKKDKLMFKVAGRVRLANGFMVPSVIPFKTEAELSLEGISKPR
jgi:LEA14-like dessication related protein